MLRLLVGYSIDFYKCRLSYEKTKIVFDVSLVVFYRNMVYVLIGCGPTELIKTMGAGITFKRFLAAAEFHCSNPICR